MPVCLYSPVWCSNDSLSGSTTSRNEWKTAEIGTPRADSLDAVLAHYHRSVQVMDKIAAGVSVFRSSLGENRRMTRCCRTQLESRRRQEGFKIGYSRFQGPRGSWSICVRSCPEELVADALSYERLRSTPASRRHQFAANAVGR